MGEIVGYGCSQEEEIKIDSSIMPFDCGASSDGYWILDTGYFIGVNTREL